MGRRLDDARFATERALAPHVEPEWSEAVILELRAQGVPGDRIGAALAEVDAHCVDSGETAADAFGDPVVYARSLDLPAAPLTRGAALLAALPHLVQTLGMLAVLWSVPALRRGEPLELTVGTAVTLVILVDAVAGVALFDSAVLRFLGRRPGLGAALGALVLVAMAVPLALGGPTLVALPAAACLGVGVVVLAGGTVWCLRQDLSDPLVAPLEPQPPVDGAGATHRMTWVVVAVTTALAAVGWWTA
jgi:hypothetical protein